MSNLTELASLIDGRAVGPDPFVLAVAGPPGSGKSTLAERLCGALGKLSCVVPMDGFHLDNAVLADRGLLHRKGAPETFDHAAFVQLVQDLRHRRRDRFPTFDRDADRVVPKGGALPPDVEIIVFEGNYLLLDAPGWAELQDNWDASVWIDVPDSVLEARLIKRWLDHGLSPGAAANRARQNDMANARLVKSRSAKSTWVIDSDPGKD